MEEEIQKIFSRQYKRMENELKDVNVPPAVTTIQSTYWKYLEGDVLRAIKKGDRNGNRENTRE
jgi:hypothetical protein